MVEAVAGVAVGATVVVVVEVLITKRHIQSRNIQGLSMVEDLMVFFILTIYHQITTTQLDTIPHFTL